MIGGTITKRTIYGVRVDGTEIILFIGDRWFRMSYDVANQLAVMLRGQARKAKRNAGDTSIRIVGFADLTDATLEELRLQANRDRTAVFSLRR